MSLSPEVDDRDLVEEGDASDSSHEPGPVMGMTFNTITNVIGGGVLNIPQAMNQASLFVGIFLCIFSSACSTFSVYTLVRACDRYKRYSMQEIWCLSMVPTAPRKELAAAKARIESGTYVDDLTKAKDVRFLADHEKRLKWQSALVTMMTVMIFLYNFGCLVLYAVVISTSIPPVVENFLHGHGFWVRKELWLACGGLVFFVLSCVRKMDELKWSSILGFVTILYIVLLVIIKYFMLEHSHDFGSASHDDELHLLRFEWLGISDAMTTLALAYCYHYNVPYFYKELNRRTTGRMLMTAALSQPVTFLCYVSTGVFGYLLFGSAVSSDKSGGDIVKNFSEDDVAVNIGRLGLFIHFSCVYPILAVSCRRGMHRMIVQYCGCCMVKRPEGTTLLSISSETIDVTTSVAADEDPPLYVRAAEALSIVLSSIIIAYFAHGITLVINITGALFGSFIMFMAPGLMGIRMYRESNERLYLVLSVVLAVFGFGFSITATYSIATQG